MTVDAIRRMTRAQLEEYILTSLADMPPEKAVKLIASTEPPEEKGE